MKNIPPHIINLVAAYISKEISKAEFDELEKWINESSENRQLFLDYLYVYKKSKRIKFIENADSEKAWNEIIKKLNRPLDFKSTSPKKGVKVESLKKTFSVLKYAAFVVILFGIGYLYQNNCFFNTPQVTKPIEQITLQLNDGKVKVINEDGSSKVLDDKGNVVGEQKGNQLVYGKEPEAQTLVYNTLTIPYGKRFEIKLSDGTMVHLNSGSSLKYPVSFIKGEQRKVFLNGEAYFDVAKDTKHPFIVNTDNMNIRVLGTQFNVSSYPEDKYVNTVLVEGAVSIYDKDDTYTPENATALKPGFKAAWGKQNGKITVEKADIEMATAWIDGRIIFRRTPFNDIVKKLERHYNVTIINNNKVLGEQHFGASFDVETIEQVLESFSANFQINYTIQNNKIIIN